MLRAKDKRLPGRKRKSTPNLERSAVSSWVADSEEGAQAAAQQPQNPEENGPQTLPRGCALYTRQ